MPLVAIGPLLKRMMKMQYHDYTSVLYEIEEVYQLRLLLRRLEWGQIWRSELYLSYGNAKMLETHSIWRTAMH